MSETQNPNPSTEERRAILQNFLNQKAADIRIDDAPQKIREQREPSRIVQANADGSLKPVEPPPDNEINFRSYPDGTFCKFTEIKDKPGFIAICLNTSPAGEPDILKQVGIVKSRAVADMLCDGLNCMMQMRVMEQQVRASAQEEANETACDIIDIEPPAAEHVAEAHNPEPT